MRITNEAKVGFLVAGVVAALAVLTVKAGNLQFKEEGYYIFIRFQNIDGVSLKAPVMYNGFEVGLIEHIEIVEDMDETYLELRTLIDPDVRIKAGSVAHIKNLGFLGEKYVALRATGGMEKTLEAGAVIEGQEPADLDKLMHDGEEIAAKIKSITSEIDTRLDVNRENIDSILSHLDITVQNFVSITDRIDERIAANEDHIDAIMHNLRGTSVNLEQFSHDLKLHPWKLMYRTGEKEKDESR